MLCNFSGDKQGWLCLPTQPLHHVITLQMIGEIFRVSHDKKLLLFAWGYESAYDWRPWLGAQMLHKQLPGQDVGDHYMGPWCVVMNESVK